MDSRRKGRLWALLTHRISRDRYVPLVVLCLLLGVLAGIWLVRGLGG
jgi:hypothetical protein